MFLSLYLPFSIQERASIYAVSDIATEKSYQQIPTNFGIT